MSDQETLVRMAIAQFYKTKKYEEGRQRILKLADHLSKKHLQDMYINNLFTQFKKSNSPENFSQLAKRFLKILHETLLRDSERREDRRYGTPVSAHLIEIYSYIFKHVFKNISQLSDLIIVLKMYRMQWAKIITDSCFDAIKIEISRQFANFDMDKNINQDLIQKIVKKYRKRGFSEQQIPRYLSCLKKNTNIQKETISNQTKLKERYHPRSSSQEQESQNSKISSHGDAQFSEDSQSNERNPSKKTKISHQYTTNISKRNQFGLPFQHFPNVAGYSYQQQQGNPISKEKKIVIFPASQSHGYVRSNINFHQQKIDPKFVDKNILISSHNNPYKYIQTQPESPYEIPKENYFNFDIIARDLFGGVIECKQCGAYFPNQKLYDSHIQDHFIKAKIDFQLTHKKEGKQRQILKNEQQWIEGEKFDLSKVKFRVRVKNNQTVDQQCIFCNNKFQISWSDQISEWIYENAIEAMISFRSQKTITVVHFECYKIFNEEDSSGQLHKQ